MNNRSNNGIGIPTAQSKIHPTAPFVLFNNFVSNAFTFSPNVLVETHLLRVNVLQHKLVQQHQVFDEY